MAADASGDAPTLRVGASLGDSGDENTVRKDLKALCRGDRLDHFVVLGLLGEGGMGSVYSAYDPDLDRKVAIKLLRSSTPDGTASEGQQRLLREAQAMAKLAHPNVVGVHEVGTFGDQVFVAMDYVDGCSLGDWLREQPRPWRDVVRVFQQAGMGLAAAHEAGLVHRDFKPDNVLLRKDGRACVSDFGLASAELQAQGADSAGSGSGAPSSNLTQAGCVLGTPAYMAPEQFETARVDCRADQFSFCASLYEALFGQLPFEGDTFGALRASITAGKVRSFPAGSPVPGWIRAVVLRGLGTDPAARYPSMTSLLDALGRDPRAAWRKRAVAGLSAVALAGVAVGGSHLAEQRRHLCQGADAKLAGVWDDAGKAAARAAFEHTGLPYTALAWASVERALDAYRRDWAAAHAEACEATRRRGEQSEELLDLRMSCLARRRQELKAVAELFAAADAQLVEQAERVAAGLSPLADCGNAEALTAPLRPPKDERTRARLEESRGQIAAARALKDGGKYREGLAAADRAVATAREARYDPVEAEALAQRGELQVLAGQHEEAEATLEDALCAAQRGRHDEVAARCSMLLAGHAGAQARPADAHWWARLASAVLQRAGGDPVAEGRLAETVARLLFYEGRYDEALAELHRGEALLTKALGAEHPYLASLHDRTAQVLERLGRYDEMLAVARLALARRERALGLDHPEVASSLDSVGDALADLARSDEALAAYRRSLAIRERALDANHPSLAASHTLIGSVLSDQGKYEEALAELRRSLAIQERAFGPDHPEMGRVLGKIGDVLGRQGKRDDALATLRRSLEILEKALGPEHADVAATCLDLGNVLDDQGRHEEALAQYRRALAIDEKKLGKDHAVVGRDHNNIGFVLEEQRRFAEAIAEYSRALAIKEAALGPDHPGVATTVGNLGKAYLQLRDYPKAIEHLERAVRVLETKGPQPDTLGLFRFALARALQGGGEDRNRALALARKARQDFAGLSGRKNEVAEIEAWIAAHR